MTVRPFCFLLYKPRLPANNSSLITYNFLISVSYTHLVLTTGCSDSFLEVENPTGEPLEDYYTTDEHIQAALIAAYDPLHWPEWGLGQYNALNIDGEIMGDNFWVGGATKTCLLYTSHSVYYRLFYY